MTTKFVSLKSILYQVSLLLDDVDFKEEEFTNFALQALRMFRGTVKLEDYVAYVSLTEHKAALPSNLVYLVGVAYRQTSMLTTYATDANGDEIATTCDSGEEWKMMKLSTSIFHDQICPWKSLTVCNDCTHNYAVSTSLNLTSSLDYGDLMVAYKGYPMNDEGDFMLPDNQDLHEAIINFVLYKVWLTKYLVKEDGAEQRMQHFLSMWNMLSKKALNLNLPDVGQMENIMAIWNRLVPRSNRADDGFSTLNSRENVNF